MYVYRHKFRVRYPETDRMGIVYHSNYIIWFDIGRTEFLRSLGYTYRELEEQGIWLPIIQVGCKYKSPARYDDEITIHTYIEELGRVKVKFGYKIYRGDELLAEGFSLQGITNDKLKPIALDKHNPEVYNKLLECTDRQ
ncbi:acyl-CoA thioesterase [Fonticella tunisiensis]|uniref:Acyl-CoA thioester hydrolase n=1 Tax=Fonticella tunisiensis TaxID=1096341 RepID=A0A4R7KUA0_9CLOT|nr:thioesterase family protein [Fonticella tunisiensis]TDT63737.1 acyl-CoA thioester hydrolase [Fonticella tunisiensis]